MDPNETLDQIRDIIERGDRGEFETYEEQADAFGNALDKFIGLDDWLSKGGFKPKDWE